METAALTSHVSSLQCPAAAAHAHGLRRRGGAGAAAAALLPRRRQPCAGGRIRALPSAEVINEILSPKLVPGSPADTGDVSSLVPVSALMLIFYFVSNWVVPELLMKRLKEPKDDDEDQAAAAAAAAAMSSSSSDGGGDASPRKIRLKVKKKKNGKSTIVKV